VVSIPVFLAGSIHVGAVCLTCLATYVLVAAYASLAFLCADRKLPAGRDVAGGLAWVAAGMVVMGGVVYFQARTLRSERPTGAEEILRLSSVVPADATPDQQVAAALQRLPDDERQFISDLRDYYLTLPPVEFSQEPRERSGPPDAPVRIVEWTDIKCPHCRDLLQALAVIRLAVPEGRISIESRVYPLDSDCNHQLQGSDGTGLRCLGAKAQLCVEGTPQGPQIVSRLFQEQDSLTKDSILEIAGSGSLGREALERCVQSPTTEEKLQQDVAYANHFRPSGTPFVILNGKAMPPVPIPVFVYLMTLSGGRLDLPAFAALPPPSRPR
jgi:protein-disulfide isomerase